MKADIPLDELNRLEALRQYQILDTPPALEFDDLTHLAAQICGTPMALITLVDSERQWIKSAFGIMLSETPREVSFCAHAILNEGLLLVPDTREDKRFADNPFVIGEPNIRFYAGVPLVTPQHHAIGTLCVVDLVPRQLEHHQMDALRSLARQVMSQLELQRIASEAAHVSQRFWQATLDALPSHIAVLDETGAIVATNRTWRQFMESHGGGSLCYPIGVNYIEVCERVDGEFAKEAHDVAKGIRDVITRQRSTFQAEYACHGPKHKQWFEVRITRFRTPDKTHIVVAHEDITSRKRVEQALQESNSGLEILAHFDSLTGIRNRRSFDERLHHEIAAARRYKRQFSVAIFDIDHFKRYNDTYGHLRGDTVLKDLGHLLRHSLRPTDFVARYGGEEFALLLPETGVTGSIEAAERTRLAIESNPWRDSPITASFGVATWERGNSKSLLAKADAALYAAKAAGRNTVRHNSQLSSKVPYTSSD